jgi:hypothetical protein
MLPGSESQHLFQAASAKGGQVQVLIESSIGKGLSAGRRINSDEG